MMKITIVGMIAGVSAQVGGFDCGEGLDECLNHVRTTCDAVDDGTGSLSSCCDAISDGFACVDQLGERGCDAADIPEDAMYFLRDMENSYNMYCADQCGMGLNECLAPVGPVCDNVDATGDLPGCCEIIRYSLSCVDGLGELGCERGDIPDDAAEGIASMEYHLSTYCDECFLRARECLLPVGDSCDRVDDDPSAIPDCCDTLGVSLECLGELDDPSCLMPGGGLAEDVTGVYEGFNALCRAGEYESCREDMECRDGLSCVCEQKRRRSRHLNFGSLPSGDSCMCKRK